MDLDLNGGPVQRRVRGAALDSRKTERIPGHRWTIYERVPSPTDNQYLLLRQTPCWESLRYAKCSEPVEELLIWLEVREHIRYTSFTSWSEHKSPNRVFKDCFLKKSLSKLVREPKLEIIRGVYPNVTLLQKAYSSANGWWRESPFPFSKQTGSQICVRHTSIYTYLDEVFCTTARKAVVRTQTVDLDWHQCVWYCYTAGEDMNGVGCILGIRLLPL